MGSTQGRPSEAVHFVFAGQKTRQDDEHTLPGIDESERAVVRHFGGVSSGPFSALGNTPQVTWYDASSGQKT